MNVDEAYDFCRAITHKHGANFSVGFRFLPKVKRRAVYAAYAYCRFADDIADEDDATTAVALSGRTARSANDEAVTDARSDAPSDAPSPGAARHPLPASGARGYMETAPAAGSPSPRVRGEGARRADEGHVIENGEESPSPAPVRSSASLRMTRLDQWQRELDAAYSGTPAHPVTIALQDALQHFAIPKSAFIALIDGCRQDMVKTRYETFEELLQYCDYVASSISDISLSIFGYRSDKALGYGRSLSTALQLTNVTRDIGDDVTRDRIYIPREELRRFGVEEREIFERAENDRMRKLIEFQIARAESYFREAEPLLRELAFDARFPTLLMGGVYATVLAKLRKDPLLAVRERLSLSALQKLLVVGTRVLRPHFV